MASVTAWDPEGETADARMRVGEKEGRVEESESVMAERIPPFIVWVGMGMCFASFPVGCSA